MKKFLKSLTVSLAIAATATMIVPGQEAYAKTHYTYIERGVKRFCYAKDEVTWTTNSKKITAYEAQQKQSGLFIKLKGITKKSTLSSSTKFALLCKHTFLAGATVSGVELGYARDYNDMLYIYRDGKAVVKFDS